MKRGRSGEHPGRQESGGDPEKASGSETYSVHHVPTHRACLAQMRAAWLGRGGTRRVIRTVGRAGKVSLAAGRPHAMAAAQGQVAEWFKAAVLKTAVGASSPWVRIPPCPPGFNPTLSRTVSEKTGRASCRERVGQYV